MGPLRTHSEGSAPSESGHPLRFSPSLRLHTPRRGKRQSSARPFPATAAGARGFVGKMQPGVAIPDGRTRPSDGCGYAKLTIVPMIIPLLPCRLDR